MAKSFIDALAGDFQPEEFTDSYREALETVVQNKAAGTPHAEEAEAALARLKAAAVSDDNVFAVLMDAARVCSLGQVTEAFFEVGGQYRRNV